MTRIPSTQALRALDAFARHGTIWQAADELCLTCSAVSHQLRLLERDFGFRLLHRIGTRVELTPQGRAYAEDVRRALAALAGAAARQAGRGVTGTLTVSCTPGFASAWLCPRIGRFRAACPDVALRIVTPRRLDDVSNPEADLFIAFATPGLAGVEEEELAAVTFHPLCSPAYLNKLGGLAAPSDLARGTLLHLGDATDWVDWCRIASLPPRSGETGPIFSDMNIVHAAALAGQGIALGDAFTCGTALAEGRLVRPLDLGLPSARSYRLAVPLARLGTPVVVAFRAWLRVELPTDEAETASTA